MPIDEHISEFAGLPVIEFKAGESTAAPATHAYRLGLDWEAFDNGDQFSDLFAEYLTLAEVDQAVALVIGDWGGAGQGDDSTTVVEALVAAKDRLPRLRALFLGEMTVEESEISWIVQSDVGPLFAAFPQLEEVHIRGGNGLSLGRPQHDRLKTLVIETGGLPGSVVRELGTARLPQLEHLELWLGDGGYGRDVAAEDLQPILEGKLFPKLKYLGLRNDEQADETAQAVAPSDVVKRIEVLDLSLGTMGDLGGEALLQSAAVRQLKGLDLHHNYFSPTMADRLKQLGPVVNIGERQEADRWNGEEHRYCAVSE